MNINNILENKDNNDIIKKDEINDMKADGNEVSITSVVKEYDSNGNLTSVTVGVKNETTGEKEYKHYKPNTGDNNAANS